MDRLRRSSSRHAQPGRETFGKGGIQILEELNRCAVVVDHQKPVDQRVEREATRSKRGIPVSGIVPLETPALLLKERGDQRTLSSPIEGAGLERIDREHFVGLEANDREIQPSAREPTGRGIDDVAQSPKVALRQRTTAPCFQAMKELRRYLRAGASFRSFQRAWGYADGPIFVGE